MHPRRQTSRSIFLITCCLETKPQYFVDVNRKTNCVTWTKNPIKSMQFKIKDEAERFRKKFLFDRDCVVERLSSIK